MMSYCHLVDSIEMGFFTHRRGGGTRWRRGRRLRRSRARGVRQRRRSSPARPATTATSPTAIAAPPTASPRSGSRAPTTATRARPTPAARPASAPIRRRAPARRARPRPPFRPAGGTFTGTTSGASTVTSTCGGAGPEAVFNWTPTGSGVADLDACASNFNTVLHVHTGTCEGGPQLTCNDDDGTCGPRSRLSFAVAPGTTYYVFVDGYGGAQGDFGLSVNLPPTPTCSASPLVGCKLPASKKSSFQLKANGDDTKDQLAWKWGNGALTTMADLGSPTTTDFYQLCVYDTGGLKTSAVVTPGGSCTRRQAVLDHEAGELRLQEQVARARGHREARPQVQSRPRQGQAPDEGEGDVARDAEPRGLVPPLRVQLVRTGGTCWERASTRRPP